MQITENSVAVFLYVIILIRCKNDGDEINVFYLTNETRRVPRINQELYQ